jgi:formylglycine-generating enzyme required for sulfatase activity/serine/threonine protein kinase
MPVALETFLSQLSDSGILSDQKLRAAENKKSEHQDGESLAKDMIKSGHLTKYQAEQILSGKGKNLCMGQYVLLEKLGAGGMGQVFKAYHPSMDRTVAIKVILTKGKIDEESVRRFEREVKAAAKLSHQNIITVYDAGNANGRHFMVMELVKGQDLNVIVHRKGTLGVSETINYIKQVARGLAFAHENGVIHRDIKPANLFLDIKGNVKILDMGLAKISARENEETLSMLTGTTAIMGTVDFMSPEQGLSSRDVDARADIYSLGATLYYFLTKKVMYEGDTAFAKVIAHSESPIPSLKAIRPDVSDNLDLVYTKMVAKQVEDRYKSMLELIQDLDAIEKGSASTRNLTELSTIYSLRNELGEMDVSRVSSKKAVQSSKSNKTIVEKDYKFALIATGIGVVLSGIVALAFILGRSSNSKNEVASKSNIENGEADIVTTNGSAEGIPTEGNLLVAPFTETKAKKAQKEVAKSLQKEVEEKEDLSKGIKLEMIIIPAGKFLMGSPTTEVGRKNDETQHEVSLTKPFYLGKYEVTQEQWKEVMGNNPSLSVKGSKLPVTDVSWDDCQDFIKKLNAKTNGSYRLPSEAEWEYACRAGTTTAYSFGDNLTKNEANVKDSSAKLVGSYKPNAFGLYDMHGNVCEWCEDWKADYLEGSVTDPKGPGKGGRRVLRGGSFWWEGSRRSFSRSDFPSASRNFDFGFRLARTVDVKTTIAPTVPKSDPAAVMPAAWSLLVAPFTEAKAKEAQKEVAKSLQKEVEEKEDLGKGIKLDLVLIPAGKFKMGDQGKDHEVTLTKPFYIGKYEVTQEQWQSVIGGNPSISTKGAKLPVTDVSWNDCQEFIKKLNASTKGSYRLPTETEWEYACRAGTTTAYSVGDSLTKADANYGDGVAGSIKEVGNYKPNAFGLYDMHGNIFEWCEDWKADYPLGPVTDPKGPGTGIYRILRGGSFNGQESIARSSLRFENYPSLRVNYLGLRLARTVDVETAVAPTVPKPDPAELMPVSGNLLVAPFTEAKAKEAQKEVAKSFQKEVEEKEDLGKGIKLDMVLIPAGKFMMGSPESETGRGSNETQHEVTLTNPYYLGKYEVTQEQWEVVMGYNPSDVKGIKLPVTMISWNNCQEFIKKLNAKTNGGYRLPTEAEWEYACRAGTTTAYSMEIIYKFVNYNRGPAGSTKEAGSYKPNAFGLYDMHGNVREWCEDWKADYPADAITNPKGPEIGTYRVLRGGAFNSDSSEIRSSDRYLYGAPTSGFNASGFRLARTADVKTAVAPAISNPKPAVVMPTTGNLLVAPFTEAKAKEVQKEVAKSLQREVEEKEDLGKNIKLEIVFIPAGKFKMGSPASEPGRQPNETQHEVTLTKPFYLGKHEVMQEQWERVMGNNSSNFKGPRLPVTNVSWEDCQEFIKKLNAKTNSGYRLPTEAEWEYACRAGTQTPYSCGDKIMPADANYNESGKGKAITVGSYKPNAFGLYDMHGNVWEWCEDYYRADYSSGAVTDPKGTEISRVLRGGSFYYFGYYFQTRSSFRIGIAPSDKNSGGGFRLAKTP